jgi:Domain of unknown function (DUF3597)
MSIFSAIKNAIFGKADAATPPPPAAAPAVVAAASGPTPISLVNCEAILDSACTIKGAELNWRTSIVDLLKLCDLDSSLGHRQELAKELGYSGDMHDSASMNIWLHKQVMTQIAANGGYVPAEALG